MTFKKIFESDTTENEIATGVGIALVVTAIYAAPYLIFRHVDKKMQKEAKKIYSRQETKEEFEEFLKRAA